MIDYRIAFLKQKRGSEVIKYTETKLGITKDGHTMFDGDIVMDLNRKSHLEALTLEQQQEIADQNRKIEDKAKLIKGVDNANSQMSEEIAELKCLVDFDTKAILKDSDTIDAQQQQIECLKKQISQLKSENESMAAYAEQRINMLTRANKKLGGEL